VPPEELDAAIVSGFEEAFGVRFETAELKTTEALRAAELRCWKYDSIAWTHEARLGTREERWGPPLHAR
jgi:hypothetical protein